MMQCTSDRGETLRCRHRIVLLAGSKQAHRERWRTCPGRVGGCADAVSYERNQIAPSGPNRVPLPSSPRRRGSKGFRVMPR
ncbi:hypothetical protein [Lysobacter gummosus]|uniref:hypothetical protein n=1 Tax=Lysobacter gummosus TaxID=262324 RepID=UPI00362716FE